MRSTAGTRISTATTCAASRSRSSTCGSSVTGERRAPAAGASEARRAATLKQALLEKRSVWFPETGFVATPVYDRDRLPAECRIAGPAIIEQMDTTTVVPPQGEVQVDRRGYLHMELEPWSTEGTPTRAPQCVAAQRRSDQGRSRRALPARDRGGDGRDAHAHGVLAEHQGARRLLDRDLRSRRAR